MIMLRVSNSNEVICSVKTACALGQFFAGPMFWYLVICYLVNQFSKFLAAYEQQLLSLEISWFYLKNEPLDDC